MCACVCVYIVCKQNDLHTIRPSDGVRNNTHTYTIIYNIQNSETESVVSKVFFASLLSFFLSFSIHPANKRSIYSRGGGGMAAMAVTRRVNVWLVYILYDTIQRPRWRKPRFVFYHHRVLLLLLLCTLQYKRSCEFHAQMTDTRIYRYTKCDFYCAREFTHTHVYNNMRMVQVGQCNIIYVAYTLQPRRIVPIYNNNLWFYVYLLCLYNILLSLGGALNKRPLYFAVGP